MFLADLAVHCGPCLSLSPAYPVSLKSFTTRQIDGFVWRCFFPKFQGISFTVTVIDDYFKSNVLKMQTMLVYRMFFHNKFITCLPHNCQIWTGKNNVYRRHTNIPSRLISWLLDLFTSTVQVLSNIKSRDGFKSQTINPKKIVWNYSFGSFLLTVLLQIIWKQLK